MPTVKTCTKCNEDKSLDSFCGDCSKQDGRASQCKSCRRATQEIYYSNPVNKKKKQKYTKWYLSNTANGKILYAKHKDNYMKKWFIKTYGITIEDRDRMLVTQNGLCDICGDDISGKPCVDHCHQSNKIRSLLCMQCNCFIGNARESIKILESAISYLKKHQSEAAAIKMPIKQYTNG